MEISEQENSAVVRTEFTDENDDREAHYEIKIDKIEIEDAQYDFTHNSGVTDCVSLKGISIKEENGDSMYQQNSGTNNGLPLYTIIIKEENYNEMYSNDSGADGLYSISIKEDIDNGMESCPEKSELYSEDAPTSNKLNLWQTQLPEENKSLKEHTKREGTIHSKNKTYQLPKNTKTPKSFECAHCGKRFKKEINYQNHLTEYNSETLFDCNSCDYKSAKRRAFINHVRKNHTAITLLTCNYCGKQFKQRNYLTRHLRVHTDYKPFECSYCDKKFREKCNLKIHLRLHTGEKPYTCGYCNKKFVHRSSFKHHETTHTSS